MRMLLLAILAIGALALFGVDQSRAAPASGAPIASGSSEINSTVKAWCGRWHLRYCRYGVCHWRRWCH